MVACTQAVAVGISGEVLGVKLTGCGKSLDVRLEGVEDGSQALGLVTWRTLLGYCGGCRNGVGVRKKPGCLSWSDPNDHILIPWVQNGTQGATGLVTGVWVVQTGSGLRREDPSPETAPSIIMEGSKLSRARRSGQTLAHMR